MVITMAAVLIAAVTVVAVLAAPLIFRLFSLEGRRRRRPRSVPVGRHDARSHLPDPDPVLRAHRPGECVPQQPPPVLRRGLEPGTAEPDHHRHAAVAAVSGTGRLAADRRARRLRDCASRSVSGATLGIGAMAVALIPAVLATGFHVPIPVGSPGTGGQASLATCRSGRSASSRRNIAALVVVRNLTEPGSSDSFAYLAAFTFFVLPQGLLGVSIATTFQPEMSRAVARRDKAAVHQHRLARRPDDRAAHDPRRCRALRAATAAHRPRHRERRVRRRGRRRRLTRARRLRARSRRVLDLPVRASRVLRPQGHEDGVQGQRRREHDQHRAGLRAGRHATACSASAPRSPSPT